MAGLQQKFLTFVKAKDEIELEKKLFRIKAINNGKLTIEGISTKKPWICWYWIDLTSSTLNFMRRDKEEKDAR